MAEGQGAHDELLQAVQAAAALLTRTAVAPAEPKPGIYKGLSFEDYWSIPALSHTILEGFVPPRTPAHGREAMLHPEEQTKALRIGHAFHVCLLEQTRWELEYVVAPKRARRSNVDKAWWAEFEAECKQKNKNFITEPECDQFERMRDSILAHPTARELILGAMAKELTVVWADRTTGLMRKARLDVLSQLGPAGSAWTFVVDVKTAPDASERVFQKDIAKYGYHRQLAHYRESLTVLRPQARKCALVVVEKDRPYCVAVHEIDERALEQGEAENVAALEKFKACSETGVFPGYDGGMSLLDLPPWAVAADRMD